jgi:hypothetical protein
MPEPVVTVTLVEFVKEASATTPEIDRAELDEVAELRRIVVETNTAAPALYSSA